MAVEEAASVACSRDAVEVCAAVAVVWSWLTAEELESSCPSELSPLFAVADKEAVAAAALAVALLFSVSSLCWELLLLSAVSELESAESLSLEAVPELPDEDASPLSLSLPPLPLACLFPPASLYIHTQHRAQTSCQLRSRSTS